MKTRQVAQPILALYLVISAGCQDGSTEVPITGEAANDSYTLSMRLSNDIVSTAGSVELSAAVERKVDKQIDEQGRFPGTWSVVSIGADTLDEDSLEVAYTFKKDSTVTVKETFKFDVSVLGSRILGAWDLYAEIIGGDSTNFQPEDSTSTSDTTVTDVGGDTTTVITDSTTYADTTLTYSYTFENDSSLTVTATSAVADTTYIVVRTTTQSGDSALTVTTKDTAYTSSSTPVTRYGEWLYNHTKKTFSTAFYDTLGGEFETGAVAFDTEALIVPTKGFMNWTTDKRKAVFRKSADVSGFDTPDDSVATRGGGWVFNEDTNVLTVTLEGVSESGTVTFDTPGSVVPLYGFMRWESGTRGMVVLQKTGSGSTESDGLSMKLSIDAIGGTVDILNFSSTSNITVDIEDEAGAVFHVSGIMTPKKVGSNYLDEAVVSARFQDIQVKLKVAVVVR